MRLSRLTKVFGYILAAELLCLKLPLYAGAIESGEFVEPSSPVGVIEETDAESAIGVPEVLEGDCASEVENISNVTTDSDEIEEDDTISAEEATADTIATESSEDSNGESGIAGIGIAFPEDGSDSGEAFKGQEGRIELNSGAQRSANFISIDDEFTTPDGSFALVMTGLKEENRKAILEALSKHYVAGSQTPLTLVDEAFPDAEKYDVQPYVNRLTGEGFYDSMHCWAASTSNILWVSGWAPRIVNPKTGEPFSSEDDVFEYFNASFSDAGSETKSGIDWFFMGNTISCPLAAMRIYLNRRIRTTD